MISMQVRIQLHTSTYSERLYIISKDIMEKVGTFQNVGYSARVSLAVQLRIL